MFLEYVTEYFLKKAICAHYITSCNAMTGGRGVNLKSITFLPSAQNENTTLYTNYIARDLKESNPLPLSTK